MKRGREEKRDRGRKAGDALNVREISIKVPAAQVEELGAVAIVEVDAWYSTMRSVG